MSFKLIAATDLPSSVLGIQSKAFVELQIGSWVKNSEISSVGSKGFWTGPLTTPDLPVSQLEREGIKMTIICKGIAGDTVLCRGLLPIIPLLNTPGEWGDVKGQLSLDGKHAGKYTVSGIYAPRGSKVSQDLKAESTGQSVILETILPVHPANSISAKVLVQPPTPTIPTPVFASPPSSASELSGEKLEKLSGMFETVQKDNLDLQRKVRGFEAGINKQLNQVSLLAALH